MENYLNLSALYYDLSKPIGKSLDGDLEFYKSHIEDKCKVLEAGVGTGRLLIPYVQSGINIDGVDASENMLSVCKQKCDEFNIAPKLILGSVIDYDFDRYDAIIIPTGTFCLFPQIETVLQNFHRSLNDDGFILFDLIFPTDFSKKEMFTYMLDVSDHQALILKDTHHHIDWVKQETTQLLTYELWEYGKLVESELQTFKINWYGILEMRLLLEKVGYSSIELFGDYQEYEANEQYNTITIKAYK